MNSFNRSNVIICYFISFHWFIKTFHPSIVTLQSFIFTLVEENILCVLLDEHYLKTIKQKIYLPFENYDQLGNLNMGFIFLLIFDKYLFQLIVLLKPDFGNSSALS